MCWCSSDTRAGSNPLLAEARRTCSSKKAVQPSVARSACPMRRERSMARGRAGHPPPAAARVRRGNLAFVSEPKRQRGRACWRTPAAGKTEALNALLPLVYGELHRVAGGYLRRERPGQTIQATALVHEAYLRLMREQHVTLAEPRPLLCHRRQLDAPDPGRTGARPARGEARRRRCAHHARRRRSGRGRWPGRRRGGAARGPRAARGRRRAACAARGAAVFRWTDDRRDRRSARAVACDGETRLGAGARLARARTAGRERRP